MELGGRHIADIGACIVRLILIIIEVRRVLDLDRSVAVIVGDGSCVRVR